MQDSQDYRLAEQYPPSSEEHPDSFEKKGYYRATSNLQQVDKVQEFLDETEKGKD